MDTNKKSGKVNEELSGSRGKLTTDRTFVLQFREPRTDSKDWIDGRIEQSASGRAVLFQSQDHLLEFLEEVVEG